MNKIFSVLVGVALLGLVASAGAATIAIPGSGWSVSYDNSLEPYLDLGVSVGEDGSVQLSKVLNVTPEFLNSRGFIEPVTIVFRQTSYDAAELVVVTDETVTNNSGLAWQGFRFQALDGSTGTEADTRFDQTASAGFNIDPFANREYSANSQVLDVSGGIVANGETWTPGAGENGGELVIRAVPAISGAFKTFVFKEQPNIVIPLPAAAWTGLTGLAGLSLVGVARKVRSLIA